MGMNQWQTTYKRERTATWEELAEAVRDCVTMDEVLAVYSPSTPKRNHRCPCPLHCGTDYNFAYTNNGYKCYVCGASGDVITFVKDILRMSTRVDAIKRINTDLHLNLPLATAVNQAQLAEIDKRRRSAMYREKRKAAWWDRYHQLMDEWIECDKAKRTADPNSDEYASAVKRIDYLNYCINGLPEEPR